MAIFREQVPYFETIFSLPGFLEGEVLTIGVQNVHRPGEMPPAFRFPTLTESLERRNVRARALDLFDTRADLRHDLNKPLPPDLTERFGAVIDVGCIEHVFSTRHCLENYMRLCAPGGHLFIHAPVNGFLYHGLHVFSPELFIRTFLLNGFEIRLLAYSSPAGLPLDDPSDATNSILWIVGRKGRSGTEFIAPQQDDDVSWRKHAVPTHRIRGAFRGAPEVLKDVIRSATPPVLYRLAKRLRKRPSRFF